MTGLYDAFLSDIVNDCVNGGQGDFSATYAALNAQPWPGIIHEPCDAPNCTDDQACAACCDEHEADCAD